MLAWAAWCSCGRGWVGWQQTSHPTPPGCKLCNKAAGASRVLSAAAATLSRELLIRGGRGNFCHVYFLHLHFSYRFLGANNGGQLVFKTPTCSKQLRLATSPMALGKRQSSPPYQCPTPYFSLQCLYIFVYALFQVINTERTANALCA